MILYNVTIGIDPGDEREWVAWMKEQHIPEVMETGFFQNFKFYKVLGDSRKDGAVSFSIQYFARSMNDMDEYLEKFAPTLVEKHKQRFKNHVSFRTLLEEL